MFLEYTWEPSELTVTVKLEVQHNPGTQSAPKTEEGKKRPKNKRSMMESKSKA